MRKSVQITRWPNKNLPTREEIKKRYKKEKLKPYSWSNNANYKYGVHTHTYQKVLYCLSGSIDFILPDEGERITLKPGDKMVLPKEIKHAADVGPEGVTCLEAVKYH